MIFKQKGLYQGKSSQFEKASKETQAKELMGYCQSKLSETDEFHHHAREPGLEGIVGGRWWGSIWDQRTSPDRRQTAYLYGDVWRCRNPMTDVSGWTVQSIY